MTFKVFVLLLIISTILRVYSEEIAESDDAFEAIVSHRIGRVEASMKTIIQENNAQMNTLKDELLYLKAGIRNLQMAVTKHEHQLDTLNWAMKDLKGTQLTRDEHNVISEVRWTVFDLKYSFEDLAEEMCYMNTECGNWYQWSHCSVPCGSGTRIRSRDCVSNGKFQSMCRPVDVQEIPCEGNNCRVKSLLRQLDCPDGYASFQGYCFKFSDSMSNRLSSSIACESDGSHLAEIDSKEKQKIVKDYIDTVAPDHMVDQNPLDDKDLNWNPKLLDQATQIAVDGIRKHQQTVFKNYRGQVMTYFNWATGEPRNSRSNGNYCVTVNVLTGEWYMKCCDVSFYYVCETVEKSVGQ